MAQARYQRSAAPEVPQYPRGYGDDGAQGFAIAEQLNRFRTQFGQAVDPMIADQQANATRQTIADGGDVAPALGLTPIQQARNAVAQQAYGDRLVTDVAGQIAALHQEFTGDRMTDPENFAQKLDAYARPKLDAVPEAFRGAASEHFNTVRSRAVTQLQERAFAAEDDRNLKDMKAGDALDLDALTKAARDGDMQLADEAGQRMALRRQNMIDAGLMGPEVANLEAAKVADMAMGEKLYGDVMRGQGPSLEEVTAGKGAAEGLTLETRDRLAGQIRAQMAHQRSEAAHARGQAAAGLSARNDIAEGITFKQ